MRRVPCMPRSQWQLEVEALGLTWHTHDDGTPYWEEGAYYVFSASEVDRIERATGDLHEMCLQAVRHVIRTDRFHDLGISPQAVPLIMRSWQDGQPSLYGRFDLVYDGINPPKMLEYNADTPTSLLEAAVIQYYWMRTQQPEADQYNSLWESLVARWTEMHAAHLLPGETLFMVYCGEEYAEDHMTVACVLQETAKEAGLVSQGVPISRMAWDAARQVYVSGQDQPMRTVFKLYPWEWMWQEPLGAHLVEGYAATRWLEPFWKLILSSKGILAVLWEMFPGHPNLLETYLGTPSRMQEYVRKPLFSREGANVTIIKGEKTVTESLGTYASDNYVCQALAPLPIFDGWHPVIGSWVVGTEACGMGIRESRGPVTDNLSQFVPHIFLPSSSNEG